MSVSNIYTSDLLSNLTQSVFNTAASTAQTAAKITGNTSAYAQILAQKISEIDAEMKNAGEQTTGQENSSTEKKSADAPEVVKRYLPDGTIVITTYEGSSIVDQLKFSPHMLAVADYSVPPDSSGNPAIKMEARQSMDLFAMMM